MLAFPNFKKDFLLETDASISSLGAVLAQKQDDGKVRPIAYASHTLQVHEKHYGISELEALGVVWATNISSIIFTVTIALFLPTM